MPVRDLLSAASTQGGAPADPYFYDVTLLLNGDGTNGAQNNTFLDSSTNNFTITRNGNTTQGSFSPYGNLWSNYQPNAINQYLSFATGSGSNFEFTGDFTIEGWINNSTVSTDTSFYVSSNGATYFAFNIDMVNNVFNIYLNGVTPTSITSGIVVGQWTHVAMVRSGSTITLYTNGVAKGTISNGGTLGYASPVLNRNGGGNPVETTPRYVSNMRIVKGTAVYTTAFTPPTTPLTNISGTSLLTCQSNRFIDNSSNAYALTVTGSLSVQRFSPFNPTATYDPAVIGGSGYFPGTGDDLLISSGISNQFDPSSGFTFECWVNSTGTNSQAFEVRGSTNNWNSSTGILFQLYVNYLGTLYWQWNNGSNGTYNLTATAPTSNAWAHIAIGYNGTTTRIWINGVSVATSNNGYGIPTYSNLAVGSNVSNDSPINGYLSNVRFVKGTDVYGVGNSTITVPTAPLTAVSGTQLLTNMVNAGIPDLAMMNNLQTVGNAQVSTAQAKFGTGSLYFDGTGDWITAPLNPNMFFGSGEFTVECFFYTASSGNQSILSRWSSPDSNSAFEIIYYSGTLYCQIASGSSAIGVNTSTFPLNQWNHIAMSKSGTTLAAWLNGTRIGTNTVSGSVNNGDQGISIGARSGGGSFPFVGYIDEVRITTGYARYAPSQTTITVPATAFPTY
jgi:hypothetical protein